MGNRREKERGMDQLIFWLLAGAIYLMPSFMVPKHHHLRGPVIVVNVALGWTFVGWVVAMAMAVSRSKTPEPFRAQVPSRQHLP
jgi:hypothetical protein